VTLSYEDLVARLGYGTLDSVLTDSGPTHVKVKTQAGVSRSSGGEGDPANGGAIGGDGSSGPGRQSAFSYRITGPPLSATLVRQLACDAEIIPMVLGGDGVVLDLGRGTRLFTYSQRHALAERDGYFCHFPNCRRPEKWTEAHHIQHWADGGTTNLDKRRPPLPTPPHHHPHQRLDRPHERQRTPRIHPTTLGRPPPEPHPPQRHHHPTLSWGGRSVLAAPEWWSAAKRIARARYPRMRKG
jgi:hypothetical protein